jgi:hypothetical protein
MAAPDTAHRGWCPLPAGLRGRAAAGDRMPGLAQGRRSVRGGQCRPESGRTGRRRQDGRTAQRLVSAAAAAHRTRPQPAAARRRRGHLQAAAPCHPSGPAGQWPNSAADARRNPEAPRSPACRRRLYRPRPWPQATRSVLLLTARRLPPGPRGHAGDKAVTAGTFGPFLLSGHGRHSFSAASLAQS